MMINFRNILIALLISSAWGAQLYASEIESRPQYPNNSQTLDGFIPQGWYAEKRILGDLNKDGIKDAILLIRKNDPKLIIDNEGYLGADEYDANPRSLIVVLKNKGGGYSLIGKNEEIIPIIDSGVMDDPLDGIMNDMNDAISIKNNVMRLRIGFWASAGSWSMYNRTFTFRLSDGKMRLIGLDHIHTHRGSGEYNEYSINYLTRKVKQINGNISDDNDTEEWSSIKRQELIVFDDIENGFDLLSNGIESQD